MTDQNTGGASRKPSTHFLTIIVDLSHEAFASRGLGAALQIAAVLGGLTQAVLSGQEATIAQDDNGRAVGLLLISEDDEDGSARKSFDAGVSLLRETPPVSLNVAEARATEAANG